MPDELDKLLADRRLWRGSSTGAAATKASIPTGHALLDAYLPGKGWPATALTEIIVERYGAGELQLVMPALARLSQTDTAPQRWLCWIGPPYVPYAPALAAAGLELSRLLVVHTNQDQDSLWAAEQSLRSGTCAAVLAWAGRIPDTRLRRLQLAAEEGACWGLVFRSPDALRQHSPAALRLWLALATDGKTLHVVKNRGGRPFKLAADFLNPGHRAES